MKKQFYSGAEHGLLVRCAGHRDGKPCGNPLAKIYEDALVIKRNGREVRVPRAQETEIRCERCGERTVFLKKT